MEVYDFSNIKGNEAKIVSARFRKLDRLPKAIFACSKLKSLVLIKCDVKRIPQAITNFQHLETLVIRDCGLEQLPEYLADLKQLTYLEITGNALEVVPKSLAFGERDLQLHLTGNKIQSISKDFFALNTRITQLSLTNNALSELPELDEDCLHLRELRIAGNRLESLSPNFIKKLKALTFLDIRNNPYKQLPLAILNLDLNSNGCRLYAQDLGLDEDWLKATSFSILLKAFKAVSLDFEGRKVAYQLLTRSSKRTFEQGSLLKCLTLKHQEIGERALEQLLLQQQEALANNPLDEKSELAIWGKTNLPKKSLKEKIKEKGIQYVTKIKATTTHVVLAPPIKLPSINNVEQLVFIDEATLLNFLEIEKGRYLKTEETSPTDIEHLTTLLYHKDIENRTLALTIMKEGGVPKVLLTDLFLIWRDTKNDASFRKKVLSLLKQNASKTLQSKLAAKVRPIMRATLDEYTLEDNLQHYTKGTELDAWRIGRYVFRNFKNGLRFWLQHLSTEEKNTLINFLIDKRPDFVLKNCYFQALEELFLYKNAKRVAIEKANLTSFPKKLLDFQQMWYLSLGNNEICQLPDDLERLQGLRTLNLKGNKLEEFPAVCKRMNRLKVIVLAMNPLVWNKKFVDTALYSYDEVVAKRK